MTPDEIQIRQDICADCPMQCNVYQSGEINHADPCHKCPQFVWHAHGDCDPTAEVIATPVAKPIVTNNSIAIDLPGKMQPGTMLKIAIKAITGEEQLTNCACNKRERQMNEWGWIGCLKNRHTIYTWLQEEGRRRGRKINRADAASLFKAAIHELLERRLTK